MEIRVNKSLSAKKRSGGCESVLEISDRGEVSIDFFQSWKSTGDESSRARWTIKEGIRKRKEEEEEEEEMSPRRSNAILSVFPSHSPDLRIGIFFATGNDLERRERERKRDKEIEREREKEKEREKIPLCLD